MVALAVLCGAALGVVPLSDAPGTDLGTLFLLTEPSYDDSPDFTLDTRSFLDESSYADSADFALDTRSFLADISFGESAAFSMDLTGINRVWADSESFTYEGPVSAAPTVIVVLPTPNAVDISLTPQIEAQFDQDLRDTSVNAFNASLSITPGGHQPCIVTYDAARRAVALTSQAALRSGTRCTVVLSSLIHGANGVPIQPTSWSFTTVSTADRDRVVEAIHGLRETATATLEAHRDLAANNIYMGLEALWGDFWFTVARDVFDLFVSVRISGSVPRTGPGARLPNNLRSIYASYIDPVLGLYGAGNVVKAIRYMKGYEDRAELLRSLGTGPAGAYGLTPPTLGECLVALDSNLWIDDGESPQQPTYRGVLSVLDDLDAMTEEAIDDLPAVVEPQDVDVAIQFLATQEAHLRRARSGEVRTSIISQGPGYLELHDFVLGLTRTASAQLAWGIDRLQLQQDAKLALSISKVGWALIKVGGAAGTLTGVGTLGGIGVVGWADVALWGISGGELAINIAGVVDAVVTPQEAVANAVHQSADLLSQEAMWQKSFMQASLERASLVAAGGAALRRAGAGSVVFVAQPTVPNVNLDYGPSAQAQVTIRNDSNEAARCRIIATIRVPQAGGGHNVLGYAGSSNSTLLQPGEEHIAFFEYTAPRSILISREGYTMLIEMEVLYEPSGALDHVGPLEVSFRVGTTAELALLASLTEESVIQGALIAGGEEFRWVTVPAGLQSIGWRLSHGAGPDLDMHVYDQAGNHTGFDYESSVIHLAVQGSSYSGLGSYPQVIQISAPAAGLYRLRVVCREDAGNFSVSQTGVPPMPAVLSLGAQSATVELRAGQSREFDAAVIETGGTYDVVNLTTAVSEFVGTSGFSLPAEYINVGTLESPLAAGAGTSLRITVSIPTEVHPSNYVGTLEVTGTSTADGSPLSAVVSLSLVVLPIAGDSDSDGDIDLIDYPGFANCMSGPGISPNPAPPGTPSECLNILDFNGSGDVDLDDFAEFQSVFSGAPVSTLTAAVSSKTCDLNLALDESVNSEPRQGGVTELRLAFDVPPGGPGPNPVTIEQATCPAPPSYGTYSGAAVVNAAVLANELVLTFSPALENARTYRITLGPDVTSVPGQFVEFRGLLGDVNSDGVVNANDRSVVVGVWTGSHYSCATDLNNGGLTNGNDRSIVIGAWTGPQNCAP